MARISANSYLLAYIYTQPPGRYIRTMDALNKIGVSVMPHKEGFLLTVANDSRHAAQIELGNELSYFAQQHDDDHLPQLSGDELASILGTIAEYNNGDPAPQTEFNRQGAINYQEPAPHITPAAIAGLYRFIRELEKVWIAAGAQK